MQNSTVNYDHLYKAMLQLQNADECRAFLDDLCTIKELADIAQRFEVAVLLDRGGSYQEVSRATGASTATICRVNKCLHYGSNGYRTVLDRMESEERNDD